MNSRSIAAASCITLLLAITCLMTGCQSEPAKGTLSGTVMYDGEPVEDGVVVLVNTDLGSGGMAVLGPGGAYKLQQEILVGTYVVTVGPEPISPIPDADPPKPCRAPEVYKLESTTPLTVEIKEGENTQDFDLE